MNINKENFFNQMAEKFPAQMEYFCKWIDNYKKEVGWDHLFNNKRVSKHAAIKFHDIPLELQIGIFFRFFFEANPPNDPESTKEYESIFSMQGMMDTFEDMMVDMKKTADERKRKKN